MTLPFSSPYTNLPRSWSRLCNAFAYWQGDEISDASETFFDDIYQALGRVQQVLGSTDGIDFWVGETGELSLSYLLSSRPR